MISISYSLVKIVLPILVCLKTGYLPENGHCNRENYDQPVDSWASYFHPNPTLDFTYPIIFQQIVPWTINLSISIICSYNYPIISYKSIPSTKCLRSPLGITPRVLEWGSRAILDLWPSPIVDLWRFWFLECLVVCCNVPPPISMTIRSGTR